MHPYSSIDVTAAWKKLRFILSVRSDFHIIDSLLIAVHAFVNLVSMSFSVDTDDILIIYPNMYNIETITNKLNNIEPTIKLIYKFEKDNTLPFLDISLINKNDKWEFSLPQNQE